MSDFGCTGCDGKETDTLLSIALDSVFYLPLPAGQNAE
jgi:hypothetical protein